MVARVWKGTVKPGEFDSYLAHLKRNVIPELRQLPGFRGMQVWRRGEGVEEVVVTTRWESMDAIRRFSGPDPAVAVVAPEAQAVLASYDRHADHFEIAIDL